MSLLEPVRWVLGRPRTTWKKVLLIWYPMEWATIAMMEKLNPEGDWPVFSYLPIHDDDGTCSIEIILPSTLGLEVGVHKLFDEQGAPVRRSWPRAGNVELCRLSRPYAISSEQFDREYNVYPSYEAMPTKIREKVLSTVPGLSHAYRYDSCSLMGNFELKRPIEIVWQPGEQDPDYPLGTVHLRDQSYVRVFPILHNQLPEGGPRSYYRWPARHFVRGFARLPRVGSTSQCHVLWKMTADSRVVGNAFPVSR